MITLIHGDHLELSRAELVRSIEETKAKDIRRLEGKTVDVTELTQAYDSGSLFGEDTVVVVENLFSSTLKKTKRIELLADMLQRIPKEKAIVLWESKELSKSVLSKLPKTTQIKVFNAPVLVFHFLDGIAPDKTKWLLETFAKLVETQAAEIVFVLITRRIRQLLLVSGGARPVELEPWQISRLTSQARFFTMEKLQMMYARLLSIDYSIKSGQSPFSLRQELEQLLIDL